MKKTAPIIPQDWILIHQIECGELGSSDKLPFDAQTLGILKDDAGPGEVLVNKGMRST